MLHDNGLKSPQLRELKMKNDSPTSSKLVNFFVISISVLKFFAGFLWQQSLNKFIVHVKYFLSIFKLDDYVVVIVPIWLLNSIFSSHLDSRGCFVILLLIEHIGVSMLLMDAHLPHLTELRLITTIGYLLIKPVLLVIVMTHVVCLTLLSVINLGKLTLAHSILMRFSYVPEYVFAL